MLGSIVAIFILATAIMTYIGYNEVLAQTTGNQTAETGNQTAETLNSLGNLTGSDQGIMSKDSTISNPNNTLGNSLATNQYQSY